MEMTEHWENVYETKLPHQVGWTQEIPEPSLGMIIDTGLSKDAPIIDAGGGDSKLAEYLLEKGFRDITVLDISHNAIERAKKRLGVRSGLIKWIVSDVLEFKPSRKYAIWHDRAAFHFLTDPRQVKGYSAIVKECVSDFLIIGTFSLNGPEKCSGLPVRQYNENSLSGEFSPEFEMVNSIRIDHITPSGNVQNFLFGKFSIRKQ